MTPGIASPGSSEVGMACPVELCCRETACKAAWQEFSWGLAGAR